MPKVKANEPTLDEIRGYVEIDAANPMLLQQEYIRLPAQMSRVGRFKSNAKRALGEARVSLDEAKHDLERTEAVLFLKYRETLDNGNDSKGNPRAPTEAQIKAAIVNDKRRVEVKQAVLDAELSVVDAQADYDHAWEEMESIKAKKEMLVSLGADRRAELGSDPSLRRQSREIRADAESDDKGDVDWNA